MSSEATDFAALVDPEAHEPLTETAWDAERARAAIAAIVAETEEAFDADELWPAHPLDEEPDEPPLRRVASMYLGAAGVIWALDTLRQSGDAEHRRDWAGVATTLPERYRAEPDFPEEGVVPSLWMGEAGILLVAHTLAPATWQEEQLLEAVHANVDNPTLEFMWGSPGTMLAAQVMFERTRDERWRAAWDESASRLWEEWRDDLWQQDLYGHRIHAFGPAHGFAGNVFVLGRGDLLDARATPGAGAPDGDDARTACAARRRPRAMATGARAEPCASPHPVVPRRAGDRRVARVARARRRLAHRAPGRRWRADLACRAAPEGREPLPRHCGNGYAFLKLLARTGDELWLDRARAFAMHAIEQVERGTAQYGCGRHYALDRRPRHRALPRGLPRRGRRVPDARRVVIAVGVVRSAYR